MSLIRLDDSFFTTAGIDYSLDESKSSLVDGDHIIGRVQGPFFAVDGESLNKRFYSKELWEKALNETTDRMGTGDMVGSVGHAQQLDDAAFRDGKVSHKVVKLWIDKENKVGMGEALIFNTDAGRNLLTYFKGGTRLAVSSRAFGEYSGKTKSGSDIVNPKTFKLETFDFTRTPGITFARPTLVESNGDNVSELNSGQAVVRDTFKSSTPTKSEIFMTTEILETLTKEKLSLQTQLAESLGVNNSLERKIDELNKLVHDREKELSEARGELKAIKLQNTTSAEESSKYVRYKELGTPEEITEALNRAQRTISAYKQVGTVSEVKEMAAELSKLSESSEGASMEELRDILEAYQETGSLEELDALLALVQEYANLGSPDELSTVCDILENYAQLGSLEEISAICNIFEEYTDIGSVEAVRNLCDVAESYTQLGTLEELEAVCGLMEDYVELGSPSQIHTAFDLTTQYVADNRSKSIQEDAEDIAGTYKVPLDTVKPLVEKLGREDAEGALKAVRESKDESGNVANRYRKMPGDSDKTTPVPAGSNLGAESRAARLFESHSR